MIAQRPPLQATVPFATGAQTAPHWPQFLASLVVSTQAFAQFVWPAPQTTVHAPATHDFPAGHAVPQVPQLPGSESRRTQALPHGEKGAAQVMPHRLPWQTAPPLGGTGHALPQPPQLPAFEVVSTQAPLQEMVPVGHRSRHWPPEQALFAPHFTPQPPQLFGSIPVAMQALPQRVSPALQLKSQVPRAQTATASAGATQALPQAPQFIGSAFPSTQALPQSERLLGHALLQAPATQLTLPALGLAHAFVQAPQWAELELRSMQAPLQFVVPAGQTVVHMLAEHTCPDGHVVPQAPQ